MTRCPYCRQKLPATCNEGHAIVDDIAREHGIKSEDLLGRSRRMMYVRPRHFAMFRIREELGWSYPRIAKFFGKDHSSIFYALKKLRERDDERNSGDSDPQPGGMAGLEFLNE